MQVAVAGVGAPGPGAVVFAQFSRSTFFWLSSRVGEAKHRLRGAARYANPPELQQASANVVILSMQIWASALPEHPVVRNVLAALPGALCKSAKHRL